MELNRQLDEDERVWRQFVLSEEDRRRLHGEAWSGSYRWFRSPNIIDLWHYRSPAEKQRISDTLLQRLNGLSVR
jgi:hypothetical protein